jgi:hypothetical protein
MSTTAYLHCTACNETADGGLHGYDARQALAALVALYPAIQGLEMRFDALTPDTWYGFWDVCQAHSIISFIGSHFAHQDALVLCDDNGGPETPWQAALHTPADTVTTDTP